MNEIKNMRKTLRWTQQEVAEFLGVTRSTINNWERDVCLPKQESYLKLKQQYELMRTVYNQVNKIGGLTNNWIKK